MSYDEINKNRWALGKYLVSELKLPIIPLFSFRTRNHKVAGKKPLVNGWTEKTETTIEELNTWRKKNEFSNLGLPLGKNSGIVAINVDGKDGQKLLKELSAGDIPDTVTYLTPGGGKSYLYRIPEQYRGLKFENYVKKGQKEHSECALLGDGQQTVLPLSIHLNGEVYKFIKDKHFRNIAIAPMPAWMIDLMTDTNATVSVENHLQAESETAGLKSEVGCTKDSILNCFGGLNRNTENEIINSPGRLLNDSKEINKSDIGFLYDKAGNLVGLNGNIFARHILETVDLITREGQAYYIYKKNCWQEISIYKLKKELRKLFNYYETDAWSEYFEKIYMPPLALECKTTSALQKPWDYINLKNGLFNLKTMSLEPYNKNIFTTVQLPIVYNPDAQCPEFKEFLKDIFLQDTELITLVQEIIGYTLCYNTLAQKMFFFTGEGSNGKSVLCDIMYALCGKSNVSRVALKDFENPFRLSAIENKILNISAENDMNGKKLDMQNLKAIVTGDEIQLEKKYVDPYNYKPYAKLVFALNKLPYIADKTYGSIRRIIVVPFEKKFVHKPKNTNHGKIDIHIESKLIEELDGIFNFAIEGLKRLKSNSYVFSESQKSSALLREYEEDINPYLEYVRSNIEPGISKEEISSQDLLGSFQCWCTLNNQKLMAHTNMRTFLREMRSVLKKEDISFSERKSNGKLIFDNIKFKQPLGRGNGLKIVMKQFKGETFFKSIEPIIQRQ